MMDPNSLGKRVLGSPSRVVLLVYWVSLMLGTHWPRMGGWAVPGADKIVHAVAYAGLAWFACLAIPHGLTTPLLRHLCVGASIAMYATCDELSQGPIPGRTPDVGDWIADQLGMLLGLTSAAICLYWSPTRTLLRLAGRRVRSVALQAIRRATLRRGYACQINTEEWVADSVQD